MKAKRGGDHPGGMATKIIQLNMYSATAVELGGDILTVSEPNKKIVTNGGQGFVKKKANCSRGRSE